VSFQDRRSSKTDFDPFSLFYLLTGLGIAVNGAFGKSGPNVGSWAEWLEIRPSLILFSGRTDSVHHSFRQ
jgi:hypothetical protein